MVSTSKLSYIAQSQYEPTDPTLAPEFMKKMFACQHREKVRTCSTVSRHRANNMPQPSIQECVNGLAETSKDVHLSMSILLTLLQL